VTITATSLIEKFISHQRHSDSFRQPPPVAASQRFSESVVQLQMHPTSLGQTSVGQFPAAPPVAASQRFSESVVQLQMHPTFASFHFKMFLQVPGGPDAKKSFPLSNVELSFTYIVGVLARLSKNVDYVLFLRRPMF
jgi:hypothetical protein